MEPQNAGHVFNMAVIADRAGDKKQAITYYEEALEIDTLYGSGRSIPRDAVFERLAELR
jgi:Tfp pilus assembly protein PilF